MPHENSMPNLTTPQRDSDETLKESILSLLQYEITAIESERKRPGWTTWALWGAIGSISWLGLRVLENGGYTWSHVWLIFLLLSVGFDVLYVLSIFLAQSWPSSTEKGRFFHADSWLGNLRLHVFGLLVRFILLLILSRHIPQPEAWVHWGLSAYLWMSLVLTTFIFLFSFLHFPMPRNPQTKQWWTEPLVILLWLGSGSLAVFGLARQVAFNQAYRSFADWRLGMLLFAGTLLGLTMSRQSLGANLLPQLHDLRRRLALGQARASDAARQADLLLHGLTIGDVFHPQVANALAAFASVQSAVDSLLAEFHALEETIKRMEAKPDPTSETAASALLESISNRADEISQGYCTVDKILDGLDHRIVYLKRMCPGSALDIEKLLGGIKEAEQTLRSRMSTVKKALERSRQLLQERMQEHAQ